MFLAASFVVFTLYFANVMLGALADAAVLGDVGEMIVLCVAAVLFVVAILQQEARRDRKKGR